MWDRGWRNSKHRKLVAQWNDGRVAIWCRKLGSISDRWHKDYDAVRWRFLLFQIRCPCDVLPKLIYRRRVNIFLGMDTDARFTLRGDFGRPTGPSPFNSIQGGGKSEIWGQDQLFSCPTFPTIVNDINDQLDSQNTIPLTILHLNGLHHPIYIDTSCSTILPRRLTKCGKMWKHETRG